MVRLGAAVIAFVVALGFGSSAQQPTFRAGRTELVPLYVTVTDRERRLVPGLEQKDFEVLDEGRPVPILLFDSHPRPISVVVMLDTSASMTGYLDLLTAAAEQFLIRLLPEDRAVVGAFNDKIQFATELTSDRDSLVSSLKDLDFGNPTRLYDAVDVSLDKLRNVDDRRVIIVFTDGADTASEAGAGYVVGRARDEEVMIYSIGLETEFFNGRRYVRTRPDGVLKKLAEETGGGYYELKKTDELGPTFTRIAQELHSQYSLGFAPARDGKEHRIGVKLSQPGLSARARRSYRAAQDGTR
jgi:Ca-activated chloride channel family protein